MITIRIYAHMIKPDNENPSMAQIFMSLAIAQHTSNIIAKMTKGKADCSTCGIVQYNDRIICKELSIDSEDIITKSFPFVVINKPLKSNHMKNKLLKTLNKHQLRDVLNKGTDLPENKINKLNKEKCIKALNSLSYNQILKLLKE